MSNPDKSPVTRRKTTAIIFLSLLAGIGLYAVGVFSTAESLSSETSPTKSPEETVTLLEPVAPVTRVETVKDDFLFIVYVDKAEYGFDEPITVRFNLTYVGGTTLKATVPHSYEQFRMRVWNETNPNVGTAPLAFLRLPRNVTIANGWSIIGTLSISRYEQSRLSSGDSAPPIFGFTPGSVYFIQGATGLGLISGDNYKELSISAPSLAVRIVERDET